MALNPSLLCLVLPYQNNNNNNNIFRQRYSPSYAGLNVLYNAKGKQQQKELMTYANVIHKIPQFLLLTKAR